MEIIEKQVEKVKEVPTDGCYGYGDGIEQKIVESAIVFWFKDADCKAENKVVEYLGKY